MKSLHARWHQTCSWLFYFSYQSGMAWQCRPDFMLQDFLFQLRPPLPPLAHGRRSSDGALVQWKVPAHCQHRVPCLTAVVQLYLGNGWRPIRVQDPSVSSSRPIGWVAHVLPRTHFLFFRRQTCCPHNITAHQVSRNKTCRYHFPCSYRTCFGKTTLPPTHTSRWKNCNIVCLFFKQENREPCRLEKYVG